MDSNLVSPPSQSSLQLSLMVNASTTRDSMHLPGENPFELDHKNGNLGASIVREYKPISGIFPPLNYYSSSYRPLSFPVEPSRDGFVDRAGLGTRAGPSLERSPRRLERRPATGCSSTPTLSLSRRANAVASPSPTSRTNLSPIVPVRRKPPVMGDSASEHYRRMSDDYSNARVFPHLTPDRPSDLSQADTISGATFYDDHHDNMLPTWYNGRGKFQAQITAAQVPIDPSVSGSSGLPSEPPSLVSSFTSSFQSTDSPVSYATSLTSHTSYSPLYTTSPCRNAIISSSSLPSSAWPPRTTSTNLVDIQKKTMIDTPVKNRLIGSGQSFTSLQSSSYYHRTPAALTLPVDLGGKNSAPSLRSLSRLESGSNQFSHDMSNAPGSALDRTMNGPVYTPPELVHLMADHRPTKEAEGTQQQLVSSNNPPRCSHPNSEGIAVTTPLLNDIVDQIVGPPSSTAEAINQSKPKICLPITGQLPLPNCDDRPARADPQLVSEPSRAATIDPMRLQHSPMDGPRSKTRSSFGFWKRDKDNLGNGMRKTSTSVFKASPPTSISSYSTNTKQAIVGSQHPSFVPRYNPRPKTPTIDEFLINKMPSTAVRISELAAENDNAFITPTNCIDQSAHDQPPTDGVKFLNRPLPQIPASARGQTTSARHDQTTGERGFAQTTKKRIKPADMRSNVDLGNTGLRDTELAEKDITSENKPTPKIWSLFPKSKQAQDKVDGQNNDNKNASTSTASDLAHKATLTTDLPMRPIGHVIKYPRMSENGHGQVSHKVEMHGSSVVAMTATQSLTRRGEIRRSESLDLDRRRSSSLIRNSLDAISWGRHFPYRSHSQRNSKMSQDSRDHQSLPGITDQITHSQTNELHQQVELSQLAEPAENRILVATPSPSASDGISQERIVNASEAESSQFRNGNNDDDLAAIHHNRDALEQLEVPKDSRGHLSRVIEEEFFTFSAKRSSVSSYCSSSGTFYFPVVPTQPPTAILPQIPDRFRTAAALAAPPTSSKRPASSVCEGAGFPQQRPSPSTVAISLPTSGDEVLVTHLTNTESSQKSRSSVVDSGSRSTKASTRDSTPSKQNLASPGTRLQRSLSNGLLSSRWDATTKALDADLVSMTDLRFASLMTSKWLSFGRVLFSPIHTEMKVCDEDKILVVDGLGSDWSYYCALTYPRVKVHTLSTGTSSSQPTESASALRAPFNHCEDLRKDLLAKFPYPDNSFAATVIRFPVAATNATMRLLISECTRVLRPGGYMETSAMDLDLLRMGRRCRKAVRELKIQTHNANPKICLKPTSNNIQQLLGQCGYEKMSRCIIGVPAAGLLAASQSSTADSQSGDVNGPNKVDNERSDQGIVNMVSRVGRWWYSQCYEQISSAESMWTNKRLLQECEALHTSFKLLVCYAQKPEVAKRTEK